MIEIEDRIMIILDMNGVIKKVKFTSEDDIDQIVFRENIEIGTLFSVKSDQLMKMESNIVLVDPNLTWS